MFLEFFMFNYDNREFNDNSGCFAYPNNLMKLI